MRTRPFRDKGERVDEGKADSRKRFHLTEVGLGMKEYAKTRAGGIVNIGCVQRPDQA